MGFNLTDEYEEEYERGGYDDVYDYSSGSDR